LTYLLDTNVISAVAPARTERPYALVAWLEAASAGLYLSVVTCVEVRDGIAKAQREGATRKAAALEAWWDTIEHLYADRIMPFDLPAATIAGRLMDRARAAGQAPGFADVAIAATAQHHGLTILTRNGKHFGALGGSVLDPFEAIPPLPR